MNIICDRLDCRYNGMNNSMQRLMICLKETVKVSKNGFCKSREKRLSTNQ